MVRLKMMFIKPSSVQLLYDTVYRDLFSIGAAEKWGLPKRKVFFQPPIVSSFREGIFFLA